MKMNSISGILALTLVSSGFCAANAETTIHPTDSHLDLEEIPAIVMDPSDQAATERLLPIGRMLVDSTTREGLVLSCYHLNESGFCDQFRFARFENSENLRDWTWLSRPFQFSAKIAQKSARQKRKALKRWVSELAHPRLSKSTRGFIGQVFWISGLMIYGVTAATTANDPAQLQNRFQTFGWIFAGTSAVVFGGGSFLFDVASSTRWLVHQGIDPHLQKTATTGENYLIRRVQTSSKTFNRFKNRILLNAQNKIELPLVPVTH